MRPHDIDVSMVVERGLARCPRCVAVADYVFIETGSASGGLRYEVRCRKCGECYGEDSRPVVNLPAVIDDSDLIVWPPDLEPVPPRDWREEVHEKVEEVHEKLSAAAERGRAELAVLSKHAQEFYTLTRAWVNERRSVEKLGHTGG